jgi:hypothetical protein
MTPAPQSSTVDVTVLGTGILRWASDERISDRYGTVTLDRAPHGHPVDLVVFDAAPIGARGRLVAVVLHTRRSPHCGDLVRGFVPTTPTVGDTITLGTGTLIRGQTLHDGTEIGLAPDDDRARDWLDTHALYRCHSQTVRLELHPDPAPETAVDTATGH